MAVSGLTITAQRDTMVDFSHPFRYEPAAIVMQVKDLHLIRPKVGSSHLTCYCSFLVRDRVWKHVRGNNC